VIVAGAAVLATVLLSVLRWPGRSVAQAVLLFAVILSPLVALGFLLAEWRSVRIGTWFLFFPATVVWLASLDLRYGISARLARPPASRRPRQGE
jgi:hypothetical protein